MVNEVENLDDRGIERYKLLVTKHNFKNAQYQREDAALIHIHDWIRKHITYSNLDTIADTSSVRDTLIKLQKRNKPTDEAVNFQLQNLWFSTLMMDTTNQDWRVLLDKVTIVFKKITKADLAESKGKMPMFQVINLLHRIDNIWADQCRAGLQDPNYRLKTVPDLLNDFRSYQNSRPQFMPVLGGQNMAAFHSGQASLNGQGPEGSPRGNNSKNKKKCPCGNNH